jgi:hypothetical protein
VAASRHCCCTRASPRILPARRHPFAVDPETGGEESKFRPIPEPKPRNSEKPDEAELCVEIESRHHLTWASEQAAKYVLLANDWRSSIASQGVMEAVWLATTTYVHADGVAVGVRQCDWVTVRIIAIDSGVGAGVRAVNLDHACKLIGTIIGVLHFVAGLVGDRGQVAGTVVSIGLGRSVRVRNYGLPLARVISTLRFITVAVCCGSLIACVVIGVRKVALDTGRRCQISGRIVG